MKGDLDTRGFPTEELTTMKKKMVPLALLLVLLLVVAGVTVYYLGNEHGRSEDTLKISGNIEAHESVVGFKVQGRLLDLFVEEGQSLKAGDLIARLDQTEYRQQVRIDEAVVKNRQAELQLSLSGSRVQEKRYAEQAVIDAQAALELSKADFQRYQALYEKEEVSAQIRDNYAANLKRAQAAYERARANLDMVNEGVRQEQIAVNKANLHTALQMLEMSKIRLGHTELFSPISGVVLVRHAALGEIMAPGTPVVTIADLDNLWLRGYISASDMGKVELGQEVIIKSDTFPAKVYKGKVSFIASQAEFTPKSVQTNKERVTLVYRVKINLDEATPELKPGMPADAYIKVAPAK